MQVTDVLKKRMLMSRCKSSSFQNVHRRRIQKTFTDADMSVGAVNPGVVLVSSTIAQSKEKSNLKYVIGLMILSGACASRSFTMDPICDQDMCRLILDTVTRRKSVHTPARPYAIARTLDQLLNFLLEEKIVGKSARAKIPLARKYLAGTMKNLNSQRKLYDANRRVHQVCLKNHWLCIYIILRTWYFKGGPFISLNFFYSHF